MSSEPQAVTVLLVDDEPAVLSMLQKILGRRGYRLIVVPSPQEALDVIGREPSLDVLLTDKNMPGMDGFSLIDQARLKHPDVAVLLMTAFPERLPPGAKLDGYLPKPFRAIADVDAAVQSALDASQRRRLKRTLEQTISTLTPKPSS